MQSNSYDELIDPVTLQRLQDEFCRALGVYAYCLNSRKECITDISGGKEEEEKYWAEGKTQLMQSSGPVMDALERVGDGSLEDMAMEEFPEGGRVAAVAVRRGAETLVYWMVFDFGGGGNGRFLQALDLLRDATAVFFENKLSSYHTAAGSGDSRQTEQEMSRTTQRMEATTDIVGLLDSDGRPEIVVDKWLRTLGHFLQVETAEVFQLNGDGSTMDVFSQWCNRGITSPFAKTEEIGRWDILKTKKPLVISSGQMPGQHSWEANHYGLSAIMVFPLIAQQDGGELVFAATYREKPHNWDVSEVKFVSDAVKIMQSYLARQMQKDYLETSYKVLETTLDIVDCAVYVKDKRTNRVLFANQKLKSVFEKQLQNKTLDAFVAKGEQKGKEGETIELFQEMEMRWYEMVYRKVSWVDGSVATLYSLYDVTERKLSQRKVERQAYSDDKTGLHNRTCCEKDLEAYLEEVRNNHTAGAIAYLDLDDFERINDGLGYDYGDALLREVGRAIQQVEGIRNTCYRIGRHEFAVIVPPDLYGRLERILAEVQQVFETPWYLRDAEYDCTASIGVMPFSERSGSVKEIMQRVESAMFEARMSGKNRMVRYEED